MLDYDLSTLEGIEACLHGTLLPTFKDTCEQYGTLGMSTVIIATRYDGKTLEKPRTVILLSEEAASIFLPRAYRAAVQEHRATGVITIGLAFSALFESQAEVDAWRGRNLCEHPAYYQAMIATLEHKTFGVLSWQARIEQQGGRKVVGPFTEVRAMRPDNGFLAYDHEMS